MPTRDYYSFFYLGSRLRDLLQILCFVATFCSAATLITRASCKHDTLHPDTMPHAPGHIVETTQKLPSVFPAPNAHPANHKPPNLRLNSFRPFQIVLVPLSHSLPRALGTSAKAQKGSSTTARSPAAAGARVWGPGGLSI